MPTNSGYNPTIPLGVPYGRSGPATLPGSSSGFNTGPQYPAGGVGGGSAFSSSQRAQLQNALSAAGVWDTISGLGEGVWDALSGLMGDINWSDVGKWVRDNVDTITKVVSTVGAVKGAFDDAARQAKSDKYAEAARSSLQTSYDGKAPLRTAGMSGMLNPQAGTPDLSSLGSLGQNASSLRAPQTLPLATGNLQNAQRMANGPTSNNPFTRALPLASPAVAPPAPTAPTLPPVMPQKRPQTPTTLPLVTPHPAPLPMEPALPVYRTPQSGKIRAALDRY